MPARAHARLRIRALTPRRGAGLSRRLDVEPAIRFTLALFEIGRGVVLELGARALDYERRALARSIARWEDDGGALASTDVEEA